MSSICLCVAHFITRANDFCSCSVCPWPSARMQGSAHSQCMIEMARSSVPPCHQLALGLAVDSGLVSSMVWRSTYRECVELNNHRDVQQTLSNRTAHVSSPVTLFIGNRGSVELFFHLAKISQL